jgi:hypothetical protein
LIDSEEVVNQRRGPRRELDARREQNIWEGSGQITTHHIFCKLLPKSVPLEKTCRIFGEHLGGKLQNMGTIGGTGGEDPASLGGTPAEQEGPEPAPAVVWVNLPYNGNPVLIRRMSRLYRRTGDQPPVHIETADG